MTTNPDVCTAEVATQWARLPWLPPDRDHGGPLRTVAAGTYWDAVRAPAELALRAAGLLGREGRAHGALLHDPRDDTFYWLVPAGYAAGVTSGLPGATPLGIGSHVLLAHEGEREGRQTHWIVPPAAGRWLTDPAALRDALATALDVTLPRVRGLPSLARVMPGQVAGGLCIWCGGLLDGTAVPLPGQPRRTATGPGRWYPRACPRCAA